jgi:serine/threonine protein kinase
MASFAQNLRTFRSGELSLDDLLFKVDQILAGPDSPANATRLLTALTEENAKNPLPSDACTALREKLEPLTQTGGQQAGAAGEATAANLNRNPEAAQLETAHLPGKPSIQETSEPLHGTEGTPGSDVPDEIKTTGDVLNNRFELKECVGSGGMSTVYKAIDRRRVEANDRNPYVAVKVLNLEFRTHPSSLMALQRETKKCQSLAHPNIVRVYDFDRDGATVYMTLEYLCGVSLGRKLGASGFKGMPRDEALRIINDVGKALSFAHDFGIVHADFKPANVFITENGKVKVIDFGIARAFHKKDDATNMEATRFDAGSLGALTPTYASPEMFEHLEPDPRDDIYALACTAFEMLTGRHPFGRLQATAARDGGLHLKHHQALTWGQFRALKHALEFDREKRTSSVEQFLKEINRKLPPPGKLFTGLGLLALVMIAAVSASLYYLVEPGERGLAEIKTQDVRTAEPSSDRPDSPTTSVSSEKTEQARIRETDSPQVSSPASVASISEPPLAAKAITSSELASLISGVPCSALRGTITDSTLKITGYAHKLDIQTLENSLSPLTGSKRLDLSGIETVTRNQCAVIELLSGYWTVNQDLANSASITSNKPGNKFFKNEDLILAIKTPAYESFVNVDYYSLDGNVLHMLPSPRFRDNQAPAKYAATIGDLGEWTVAEPFGTELIVILTTPEPLFETPRKEHEPQIKYLPALNKRLAQLAKEGAAKPVTADFILITTQAR